MSPACNKANDFYNTKNLHVFWPSDQIVRINPIGHHTCNKYAALIFPFLGYNVNYYCACICYTVFTHTTFNATSCNNYKIQLDSVHQAENKGSLVLGVRLLLHSACCQLVDVVAKSRVSSQNTPGGWGSYCSSVHGWFGAVRIRSIIHRWDDFRQHSEHCCIKETL